MDNPGKLILLSSLTAMFTAQLFKVFENRFKNKMWDWSAFMQSGGMPSSHSALMISLTSSMWICFGWKSPWFAVALVSSIVVMYDAAGVRRQAGEQAMIITDLISKMEKGGFQLSDTI